jgi:hypothetical protein
LPTAIEVGRYAAKGVALAAQIPNLHQRGLIGGIGFEMP